MRCTLLTVMPQQEHTGPLARKFSPSSYASRKPIVSDDTPRSVPAYRTTRVDLTALFRRLSTAAHGDAEPARSLSLTSPASTPGRAAGMPRAPPRPR